MAMSGVIAFEYKNKLSLLQETQIKTSANHNENT